MKSTVYEAKPPKSGELERESLLLKQKVVLVEGLQFFLMNKSRPLLMHEMFRKKYFRMCPHF